MAFDRAAAKEAGYSNEEIDAYIAANPHVETKQDKDQRQATKLPSPEEVMGRTGSNPSQEVDRTNENVMTGAMGVGLGAAGVGIPAAAIYAGKKIFSPAVRAGADLAQRGVGAMESANAINKMGVENLQNRFDVNQANKMAANAPKGPVMPQAMPGVSTVGPVAPPNMTAANQPSMQNRVQAAAAQRITNLPNPGMMASAGRMAGKLLPGVGTALNAADAYGRFQEGDYLGAGIAGAGAVASPFPVAGTVIGGLTGGLNAYRDYLKRQEEEKLRMMK